MIIDGLSVVTNSKFAISNFNSVDRYSLELIASKKTIVHKDVIRMQLAFFLLKLFTSRAKKPRSSLSRKEKIGLNKIK